MGIPDQVMNERCETDKAFSLVILTGLSGAGKSTVQNAFEDMRYFTMEGLPPALLPAMVKVLNRDSLKDYQGSVFGVDLRQPGAVDDFKTAIRTLRQEGITPCVLFVEADLSVLVRRYASTRRPHPLESEGIGLSQAIERERSRLVRVRAIADTIIDTSAYSIHDLRREVQNSRQYFGENSKLFRVHVISFGFKYGTPSEADMIFDLRFLPNPYFNESLKPLSGLDGRVADFVLAEAPGRDFFVRLLDFLHYLLPLYKQEGRYRVTLGIGCTGGRHRSVAVAEALGRALAGLDCTVSLEHRHLELG